MQTGYRLTTLELIGLLKRLVRDHQRDYIVVYVDDQPGSGRTGGHIYEGVKPVAAVTDIQKHEYRFQACSPCGDVRVVAEASTIRSVTLGNTCYWNFDNPWVCKRQPNAERMYTAREPSALEYALESHHLLSRAGTANWAAIFVQRRLEFAGRYGKGRLFSTAHGAEFFENVINCSLGLEQWEEKGELGKNFESLICETRI
jgi:hypothetical protein